MPTPMRIPTSSSSLATSCRQARSRCRRCSTPTAPLPHRDGPAVRTGLDLRRAGRAGRGAGPVLPSRGAGREHHRHAQRVRAGAGLLQRLPPSRHAALHGGERDSFAGSIQCPYHAWTYALDGRLVGAPHMDDVPHFDKADYPLHRVARGRMGRPHLHLTGRGPAPLANSSPTCPAKFTPLAHAGPPARPPHRLRRARQLEADRPELQRVPALPEPASGAQQAVALSERRERAAARVLHGRPHGPAARGRDDVDGWHLPAGVPAGALGGRASGRSTTTRSSRTCSSACTRTT